MDLWLQLWLQEAAPGSPSSNLEKTGSTGEWGMREERNKKNPKVNAGIKQHFKANSKEQLLNNTYIKYNFQEYHTLDSQ